MKFNGLRRAAAIAIMAIASACTPTASSFSPASLGSGTLQNGDQLAGTETGNPRRPGSTQAASQILSSVCSILSQCRGADPTACSQGVQALDGMDVKLGLPANSFNPFSSLIQAESAGEVLATGAGAAACLSDITSLSCTDPRVVGAYDPANASNPFAGVVNLIPQSSCSGVFVPAGGASLVQVGSASLSPFTSAALSVPLGSASKVGDLIVVLVGSTRGVSPVSVTDSQGQTYSGATSFSDSASHFDFYYLQNSVGGVTTISVNYPDDLEAGEAIVAEYSGLAARGILDQKAAYETTGSVSAWSVGTPIATSASSELLVGAAFYAWSNSVSFVPGSSWTPRATRCGFEGCLFLQDQNVYLPGVYLSTGSASQTMVTAAIASFR